MALNAKLTIDGQTTLLDVSDQHVYDASGEAFEIPSDIHIDTLTGVVTRNGQPVGQLSSYTPTLSASSPSSLNSTLSSSTSGASPRSTPSSIATATSNDVVTAAATTGAAAGDSIKSSGESLGGFRQFATASLINGGARIEKAIDPTNSTGTGDGTGGTDDGTPGPLDGIQKTTGGDDTGTGDTGTDDTGTGDTGTGDTGTGDTNGDPDPDPDPDSTKTNWGDPPPDLPDNVNLPPTDSPLADPPSGLTVGSALSGIGQAAMMAGSLLAMPKMLMSAANSANLYKNLASFLRSGGGAYGGILGGAGVFLSMYMFGKDPSVGSLLGAIGSGIIGSYALWAMMGPWGIAVMAALALAGYLIGHFGAKKEQTLDVAKGDVTSMYPDIPLGKLSGNDVPSGEEPADYWYNKLPQQSVFFILAGVTALGIGIDFTKPNSVAIPIETALIDPMITKGLRPELERDTKKQIIGSITGKVFIARGSADDPNNPDQVVYVANKSNAEGVNDGYMVNKVTLNKGGYYVNVNSPDKSDLQNSFFLYDPKSGEVRRNPNAQADLQLQQAMTRASTQLQPGSAAAAIQRAAATGRQGMEQVDTIGQ